MGYSAQPLSIPIAYLLRIYSVSIDSHKSPSDTLPCQLRSALPPHAAFFPTFPLMEKSEKDQADGKCSRTVPLPPTVGLAPARVFRAGG